MNSRFLRAKFQLDYICKQGNETQVRAQLSKLPRGLNNTYNRIWDRITGEELDDTEREWALKTLRWLAHAKEPLSPRSVLEATSIEPQDTIIKQTRMASSLDYLIQVCGNFVALDQQTNRLRFVHYSVQELLQQKPGSSSAKDFIAEVCFAVLGSEGIVDLPKSETSIYYYATLHLQEHSRSWAVIDNQRGNLIQNFLLNPRCFKVWAQRHAYLIPDVKWPEAIIQQ